MGGTCHAIDITGGDSVRFVIQFIRQFQDKFTHARALTSFLVFIEYLKPYDRSILEFDANNFLAKTPCLTKYGSDMEVPSPLRAISKPVKSRRHLSNLHSLQ